MPQEEVLEYNGHSPELFLTFREIALYFHKRGVLDGLVMVIQMRRLRLKEFVRMNRVKCVVELELEMGDSAFCYFFVYFYYL